jgi:hypothetical protein
VKVPEWTGDLLRQFLREDQLHAQFAHTEYAVLVRSSRVGLLLVSNTGFAPAMATGPEQRRVSVGSPELASPAAAACATMPPTWDAILTTCSASDNGAWRLLIPWNQTHALSG